MACARRAESRARVEPRYISSNLSTTAAPIAKDLRRIGAGTVSSRVCATFVQIVIEKAEFHGGGGGGGDDGEKYGPIKTGSSACDHFPLCNQQRLSSAVLRLAKT